MDTKKIPWLMLPLSLLCFSLESHVSFGADTISFNQSLSGDGTIVSASGVFELGFFRPGNSSNYYIGMWYKQASQPNTVWVANREKPVGDVNSSVLKIYGGNLVLFDESELPIWSTNVSSTNSTSVVAVLLDDGNLVLREGPNSSTMLWQSFDHPADTWLPGMKLSFDKRTNQSRSFTSWKSQEDPAPGLFSIEIDPSQIDQIIFLWNRSQRYWSSGTWDEQTNSFSFLPEFRTLYLYNISYRHVSNENESYFTYSFDYSFAISRSSIDASGQFKAMLMLTNSGKWSLFFSQPRQQCDVYGYCGAFSNCNEKSTQFCNCLTDFQPASQKEWDQQLYTGGCVRQAKLQCGNDSVGNGRGDQFLESRMTTFPTNPQTVTTDSIKECKSTCLNNCSCTAYAYDESIGCSIWIGDLLNMKQLGEDDAKGKSTLHIRIAEFSNPKNKKGPIIVAVIVSVSAGVALLGGNVLSLLDNRLNGNVDIEELYRICTVACWCIQDDEIHRPSMSQIVQILEGVVEVSLPPIPRFLLIDTTLSLCSESQSTL
ncbi:S-locus glycoprotein [Corchorus olitorius]|uniref:S-locus glycoprotein n=1 Tax=Corchorus olitorius TaxID=93759 RepID=A0A1R3KU24_9ROSI|nr:S-locus glycoprotein [Corchorus olitorius]